MLLKWTSTPPLSFLQAGCPSGRPTNSVKALKAYALTVYIWIFKKYSVSLTFYDILLCVTRYMLMVQQSAGSQCYS